MRKLLWILPALLAGGAPDVAGTDWPQWGGPRRDHVSDEPGLMQQWPPGGPKRVWLNSQVGIGYSGVSVAQGMVFTLGAFDDTEKLIALREADGQELWSTAAGPLLRNNFGDGPRATPTVSGDQVFALAGQGTLVAANAADGKILWTKRMQDLGGRIPRWGYTESVLVEGQTVYCTPGGSQGAVAALDRATGALKWQSREITDEAQYASIGLVSIHGRPQLVQLLMQRFIGLDPASGKLLWESGFDGRTAVIPTPIVRDNRVYVTAGYGTGCKQIEILAGNKTELVFDNKVMKNHHGGVVLIGDHLYGYSDGSGWVCQDFKTGKEVWSSKQLGKGAVTGAGGRLYCLDEGSGTVVLAAASPSGWKEHGRFKLEAQSSQRSNRGGIWMHPVIANGRLYLRDQEFLSCYDVQEKAR